MGYGGKLREKKRKFNRNFRIAQKKVVDGSISSEKVGRRLRDALFNVDSGNCFWKRDFRHRNIDCKFTVISTLVCYNQELYLIEGSILSLQSNFWLKCKKMFIIKRIHFYIMGE
ncbi:hypothetical protein TNCV_1868031 [Trichonephila clavipes]|nr:hypothetical protein TNCV_1868031 [Trichonephila clavipes]